MRNLPRFIWVGAAGLVLVAGTACGGGGEKQGEMSAQETLSAGGQVAQAGAAATPGAGGSSGDVRVFGARAGLVAGQIEQVDGTQLTLSDPAGKRTVTLTPATEVRQTKPAAAADVKQGVQVSVTGVAGPDGRTRARLVQIAPPVTPEGHPAGFGVTEGTVESVSGDSLRVRAANGSFVFVLTGETEYQQTVPASVSDLAAGQWVMAAGEPDGENAVKARTVTITPAPTRQVFIGGPGGQSGSPGKLVTATPGAGSR